MYLYYSPPYHFLATVSHLSQFSYLFQLEMNIKDGFSFGVQLNEEDLDRVAKTLGFDSTSQMQ
jgi:hypothetical protein